MKVRVLNSRTRGPGFESLALLAKAKRSAFLSLSFHHSHVTFQIFLINFQKTLLEHSLWLSENIYLFFVKRTYKFWLNDPDDRRVHIDIVRLLPVITHLK